MNQTPQQSVEPALSIDNVTFGYEKGQSVLRGVWAELGRGRLCALIGPNAAGKTTLMRVMLGQLRPTSGVVRLDGQDVAAMSASHRAAVMSYVPQRGSVSFAFTVRQVIEMGRFASGDDVAAVNHAIKACDLEDVQYRVFGQLSGGQQQRVMLARALAQVHGRGVAMLLDEPGSHMDLWHVHSTMRLLRQCAQQGLAVLVVLHDLNLAAAYADEVWLMQQGRLVAQGGWAQMMQPQLLEPIYRVRLRSVPSGYDDRQALIVESTVTMDDEVLT